MGPGAAGGGAAVDRGTDAGAAARPLAMALGGPLFIGSSLEYTTFNFFIPLVFNSFLITFASGHTLVL